MPKLYNLDHQPAIISHDQRAVMPGESHDFTKEQAKRLSGSWSEQNPREGLDAEKAFKQLRDEKRPVLDKRARALGINPEDVPNKETLAATIAASPAVQDSTITNPAESGKKE